MRRTPEVEFLCPECETNCVVPLAGRDVREGWTCAGCESAIDLVDPSVETGTGDELRPTSRAGTAPVVRCAACACPKLYVQKDFNRNVGLLIVAVTALISGVVLMLTHSTIWAMAVLGVVTVFDAFIYRLLPIVTVCYRCEAVHRGLPKNPRHEGFDIHTAEEFAYGKE